MAFPSTSDTDPEPDSAIAAVSFFVPPSSRENAGCKKTIVCLVSRMVDKGIRKPESFPTHAWDMNNMNSGTCI